MRTIDLEDVRSNNTINTKIEVCNGLSHDQCEEISSGLGNVLADSYTLMLKMHNYHWNVRGNLFYSIHNMTEEQYTELFKAIDVIAERIRALGFVAPASFKEFVSLSKIECGNNISSQEDMIADLVNDMEHMVKHCRNVIQIASEYNDEVTVDLLTNRMNVHAKSAWMLRSLLEK